MLITFSHGLSDEDSEALCENIAASSGFEVSADLEAKIGNPFYEVTFTCTLDTETGKVEIVSTKMEAQVNPLDR